MQRIKAIYRSISEIAANNGLEPTKRLPHAERNVRRYVYPGLATYKGDKLYGYTMRIESVRDARTRHKSYVRMSIMEWFAGKAHSICDVDIRATDSDVRKSELPQKLIEAYVGLSGKASWMGKL